MFATSGTRISADGTVAGAHEIVKTVIETNHMKNKREREMYTSILYVRGLPASGNEIKNDTSLIHAEYNHSYELISSFP
jgi:hypothetical protein